MYRYDKAVKRGVNRRKRRLRVVNDQPADGSPPPKEVAHDAYWGMMSDPTEFSGVLSSWPMIVDLIEVGAVSQGGRVKPRKTSQ